MVPIPSAVRFVTVLPVVFERFFVYNKCLLYLTVKKENIHI